MKSKTKQRWRTAQRKRPYLPFTRQLLLMGLALVWALSASSQQPPLREKVSLKLQGSTLSGILDALDKQSAYSFAFIREDFDKMTVKDFSVENIPLGEALEILQKKAAIEFTVNSSTIVFRKKDTAPVVKQKPGKITGKVIDEENGQPVGNASIRIGNTSVVAELDGSFSCTLPQGQYEAIITSVGYGQKLVTDLQVKDQETIELNVTLKREKGQLQGVVVRASARQESVNALYSRQKNNMAISDGISAEQIRRTPDNNAAQVLKRISGVTVQDDKFITIRGLSDRYNNVLLNGATLPSTEPNRRNFAFDIIPGSLIDNIVINKTATPDMPGEFSGGLVQVTTKDLPAENYATLSLGSGINTNTYDKPFYSFKRGSHEFIGVPDKNRTWWLDGWNTEQYRQYTLANDKAKLGEMGRAIPNNFGLLKYKYLPMQNAQLGFGRKMKLNGKASLGITLAASYRHEEVKTDEMRYAPGEWYFGDTSSAVYSFNSSVAGVANIAYQTAKTKIAFKNLYNRRLSNRTTEYDGYDFNASGEVKMINNVLLINSVLHNRLEGEHLVGNRKIKIDWSADLIRSDRDQPDTRSSLQYYGGSQPQGYYLLTEITAFLTQGINVFNSKLRENKKIGAINATIPFKLLGQEQKFKAGYSYSTREAAFSSLALRLHWDGTAGRDDIDGFYREVYGLPDYVLASPDYVQPGLLRYKVTGVGGQGKNFDDYTGDQHIHAPYIMADLKLLENVRVTGGMRIENNHMRVKGITFDEATGRPVDSIMNYNTTDWLPSVNLVYSLNKKMNVRIAWSRTLARADFRERARFQYWDFDERNVYSGAQSLRDGGIINMDLRYEYYPAPGEVLSASLFYKKFDSPVELVASLGSSGLLYYYFNLRSSTSKGIEIDLRKSLNFINPASGFLRRIFINGNASLMSSNVRYNTDEMLKASNGATGGSLEELPPDSRNRALQGLSPYTVNGGIGYFGETLGIQVSYNRYGKRIVSGGLYPWQDQYEAPRDILDLQLSGAFLHKKLEARLNLSDLFQQHFIIYQNAVVGKPTDSGGGGMGGGDNQATDSNPNKDPKGTNYNKDLDYTRYRGFKGRNISLSLTYKL